MPLQLFTEELERVGATCDGLEGVHHAKAKREANSKTLRTNSGVSSLNIVDDGHGMRARHAGGELVLSLADLSETTESSLGAEGKRRSRFCDVIFDTKHAINLPRQAREKHT